MTTVVTVSIQGSHAVQIKLTDKQPPAVVYPGQTIVRTMRGGVVLSVCEIGEFLGTGYLVWVPAKP